ncbi:MAG: hypothetical protein M4579_001490 [Chaenotheca gracillima]|nr:MAG: hypothetical protein M4579_001490 [Chaenotheca gracillima]
MPPKPKMEVVEQDPDAIFNEGFLADVYQQNPVSATGIDMVKTRFPPGNQTDISTLDMRKQSQSILGLHETAEDVYYESIEETVRWLGFEPAQITYSSDNFDRLYELAELLIEEDEPEIEASRGGRLGKARYACAHRDRPTCESLAEFRAMRDGKYEPHEASLRMKQDLEDGNPQMWDLTAYRVRNKPHHRTGNKWRIYPTYDFTHCLCDSFEDITHSLCTTEFELSRVSYEWLCDKVKIYKPMQREYGRLNLSGVLTSKRKINELVSNKHVRGWDDPRLYTLNGLRRRGVPPGAILAFVNELGVTKATSEIQVKRFDQTVRSFLETSVPRLMLVLDPVLVVIEDLPDDHLEMVEVPFSKDPKFGAHKVPFTKSLFIDHSDFREVDSKDYFRLAPGKSVGLLKVPYPITATSFETDPATGLVSSIRAKYEKPVDGGHFKKPKTYIQWVANSPQHGSPISAEVRVFNPLFTPESLETHGDINPKSEESFPNAIIETGFCEIERRAPWPAIMTESKLVDQANEETISTDATVEATKGRLNPESVRFQGMRVAYFCVDKDSCKEKVVLNRIVSLKEDSRKG